MAFWPEELRNNQVLLPEEILEIALGELSEAIQVLSAEIVKTKTDDRIDLSFRVENRLSRIRIELFRVTHQMGNVYPCLIIQPYYEIPEYLQASETQFNSYDEGPIIFGGKPVGLRLECDSPSVFQENLKSLLNTSSIRTQIINLIATSRRAGTRTIRTAKDSSDPE